METIKYYKLKNKDSGKVYRHLTLQNIMDKLHLGYFMAKELIVGKFSHHNKMCTVRRLAHWKVSIDSLPKGKILRNADGSFRVGVPIPWGHRWSKGNNYRHPKGYRAYIPGEFKKGTIPPNFKGVYKPRVLRHSRDGVYVVTTIEEREPRTTRGKTYMTKKRTAWARYVVGHNQIPEGYVVYHRDQNPLNNSISNLIILSRAELLKVNRGWMSI